MRLAVCELPDDLSRHPEAFDRLATHIASAQPDVLLMPELPFAPWLARLKHFDPAERDAALAAQASCLARIHDLGVAYVVSSMLELAPDGRVFNSAFVRQPDGTIRVFHAKQIFPQEPGYWEDTWTAPGSDDYPLVEIASWQIGVLLCSEVMISELARDYGLRGADAIFVPRSASGNPDLPPWDTALTMAALTSGAFVASSNRVGPGVADKTTGGFSGGSLIYDPFGQRLARTTAGMPYITVELLRERVAVAKASYPRNCVDHRVRPKG